MKSAILKNGKIEIVEKNIPDLKNKKGAIIKVSGCGLCGSDIVKVLHTPLENENKIVLGHEITGEIVDINVEVTGNNAKVPFKKGDFVAMGHHYPCMECKHCKLGHHSMCETFKKTNIYPSGFSEYIYASENHLKNTVFKKPSDLSEIEFSYLEPLSCCVRAIRRAYQDIKDLSVVNSLVIGLGSIGLLMAQGAKAYGANIFGFDINPERQNLAEKFGIRFDENLKYDVIFMTSGSDKAIDTAIKFADLGAKIIVFSSIPNDMGYKNNDIYYKELEITGSYSPAPIDIAQSFEFLSEKKVTVQNLATVYPLENINSALHDTLCGKIMKAYIKI